MIIFVVKDVRNYVLCNLMCNMFPDVISGVTYDESVVLNYYANCDFYVYINVACRAKGIKYMSFADDWSLVDDIDDCVVLSKTDVYSKFTRLCDYIGVTPGKPSVERSKTDALRVREDDTHVIEFLEHHDVTYETTTDAEDVDIPSLLYGVSYHTDCS